MTSSLNDRYKVIKRIGEGAIGEVWLAEHIHLGRQEAVKVLQRSLALDRELIARFRREARAANRLHHPNIVNVYDFGQLPDGRFYLSMEFVHGDDLRRVLRRQGRLPPTRVMRLLAQLADAIAHAHEVGVIHRDLKPENLILSQDRANADMIKVLDFGLAKVIAHEADDQIKTGAGSVFGTAEYMAPEQVSGSNSDPRMDIYSIGCIAYELLTGEPPFTGRPMAVLEGHLARPVRRPSSVRPEAKIPRELDDIVLRCLAKQPHERFQRAHELAAALKTVPGFSQEKSDSGRRSLQSIPHHDDETEEREFWGRTAAGARDDKPITLTEPIPTDTLALDTNAIRWEYDMVLGELAGALLDAGSSDINLILAHTDFNVVCQHIGALSDEMAELSRRIDLVEQQAREHESRLRFTLGELRFEIDNLGNDTLDAGLIPRIQTLEKDLVNVLKRRDYEVAALTDREVMLVSELADREEALADARHRLLDAISVQMPTFGRSRHSVVLHQQLLDKREQLRMFGVAV